MKAGASAGGQVATLAQRRQKIRRMALYTFGVFLFCFGLTVFLWHATKEDSNRRIRAEFENDAVEMRNYLIDEMQRFSEIAYYVGGLFVSSQHVDPQEWEDYLALQSFQKRHPGLTASGYVERVFDKDTADFTAKLRSDPADQRGLFAEFKIHALTEKGFSQAKSEYFILKYLYPVESRKELLGLDLGADSYYDSLLGRIRDFGDVFVIKDMPWEEGKESVDKENIHLVFPVSRPPAEGQALTGRQENFQGFVFLSIDVQTAFQLLFDRLDEASELFTHIYLGDNLIFATPTSNAGTEASEAKFSRILSVNILHAEWKFHFYRSGPVRKNFFEEPANVILIVGTVLSFLLWFLLFLILTSREQAVSMAYEMTVKWADSESRYHSIVEYASDAFVEIDEKGNIADWNPEAERVFGWKKSEVVGKALASLIIPQRLREAHQKGLEHFLKTGEGPLLNKRTEVTALRADGLEFSAEVTISSFRQEKSYHFYAFVHDISERKRAEEAMKRANEQLRESEKSLAETLKDLRSTHENLKKMQGHLIDAEKSSTVVKLAAGAAHEVKNPLAVILQGIEFLKSQLGKKGGDLSVVLDDMHGAVERADKIVKNLLTLSVSEKEGVEPCPLNEIIESALIVVKQDMEQRHVKLTREFKDGLPDIKVDRGRAMQVFVNLLINAIEAMEKGGELTVRTLVQEQAADWQEVTSTSDSNSKHVAAEIQDSGHGIPEETLAEAFEPFFTTKRATGGTGLGLSLVRSTVASFKGKVGLKNRTDGKGVIATVVFPAVVNSVR